MVVNNKAYYHLPGLFEFYEFYRKFLPLYFNHREYFYNFCEIGSIYGAPIDCLWGGGRIGFGNEDPKKVFSLMDKYNISSRLTFSNSLLREKHLKDIKCNNLCKELENYKTRNGVIVHSDLLLNYLKNKYPNLYFVSSTTKVILNFDELLKEIQRDDFTFIVPDFRFNKEIEKFNSLSSSDKSKLEFLCNECCSISCKDRKACYESVSLKCLGFDNSFVCTTPNAKEGYRFSKAMSNPSFISIDDIKNIYLPNGFSNFKIEGRNLGSALLLEFILYYMVKPEHQLQIREELYLNSDLDLF